MMRILLLAFGLIAVLFPGHAGAQYYKGKTITMIVNYPAGGPTDLEGRIVALHLPQHIPGKPDDRREERRRRRRPDRQQPARGSHAQRRDDRLLHACRERSAAWQFGHAHALFRFRADRRRREPAGRLHAQGHAAGRQCPSRPDEDQGLQGAVAQRAEHQHAEHGAGARTARRPIPGGARLSRAEGRRDRDPAEHRADGQLVAVGLERIGRTDLGSCRPAALAAFAARQGRQLSTHQGAAQSADVRGILCLGHAGQAARRTDRL